MGDKPSTTDRPPIVIGLIGGIGSGKTRVAEELQRHGALVVSGDALGHEALRQSEIREKVTRRWGEQLLGPDGEIDRRALGRIVFANAADLRELEALVFPYIERRFREEIARAGKETHHALVVLDAAVLLEAGWNKMCTYVVFVDVTRDVRLTRLLQRRGWAELELTARENAQMPLDEKRSRADFIVDNSGTEAELAAAVERLVEKTRLWSRAATQQESPH